MGGLPKYQQAFLSGDNIYSDESVSRLKSLIQEQLNVTALALKIHGRLVPAAMIPLQERLVTRFNELENQMQGRTASGEFAVGSSATLKAKSFSIGPPGMASGGNSLPGSATQPRSHLAARRARSEASDRKSERKPSIVK